jgi:hypothetical protein
MERLIYKTGHNSRRALLLFAIAAVWSMTALAGDKPPDIERARAEPAQVQVRGDTVYYTGNFSKASTAAFNTAVAAIKRGQITRMVISSGGGDTVEGRHVGRWVRDMALVLEVDVICFSSCADYVFPAGRARVIRSGAFVGWHGNDRTFHVQAARDGKSLEELLAKYIPEDASPEQRATFFREFTETTKVTQKDEADFYASLGLNDAFAVCAVGDILEKRLGYTGQIGWGFSLEDMAHLGMTNTVYLGDGAYEDSARFKKYLVPISASECLAMLK